MTIMSADYTASAIAAVPKRSPHVRKIQPLTKSGIRLTPDHSFSTTAVENEWVSLAYRAKKAGLKQSIKVTPSEKPEVVWIMEDYESHYV